MRLHKFALLPSSHKMQKVFTTPARSTCSALNIFSRAVSSSSGSLLAVFLHTRANMLGTAALQYLRLYTYVHVSIWGSFWNGAESAGHVLQVLYPK